jgi:hypothetical protein
MHRGAEVGRIKATPRLRDLGAAINLSGREERSVSNANVSSRAMGPRISGGDRDQWERLLRLWNLTRSRFFKVWETLGT